MIKGEHGIKRLFTLYAPSSTYKFSTLASKHFLKNWLREFVKRSQHFFLSYHSVNSPNLFLVIY